MIVKEEAKEAEEDRWDVTEGAFSPKNWSRRTGTSAGKSTYKAAEEARVREGPEKHE